ncbi:cytochrome c biogenesis protein [Aestuariivivens sediminis]|uniref:cytochrome c biogenesis protein n=1 Tax=Aestuariivivens sediminis TaxID=2913557 RepID=UPI001F5889E6|nr:cytochrome c biogenesis protein CcsA [Aestuariivivens sediminis]
MKLLWNSLISSKASMLILAVFIFIIASATLIEEAYDTATTKRLIYNAFWFELLMFVLVVQYIAMVIRKNLWYWEKMPQLVFHFSFVVLFIGGGITRYFGFEASMHILENEAVNTIHSVEPYLQIRGDNGAIAYSSNSPIHFSQIQSNDFHLEFPVDDTELLEITYQDYIFEAKDYFTRYGTEEEKVDYQSRNPNKKGPDALVVGLTFKGNAHEAILFYDDTKYIQKFKSFDIGGLQLEMTYGPKPIEIPFSMELDKFTLSKYPGTNIPSASESKVTLIDKRKNIKEQYLISKNKVLDYDGYRFFQTSYDDDENGTILSVNYDYYGTRVTYFGYLLMTLGALLILFSKRSHFSLLDERIKEVRAKRKALYLTVFLCLGALSFGWSQTSYLKPINKDHADRFGHVLVQTYDGRFSSINSLAIDVMHKLNGKDRFNFAGKGTMDAMQLFLDMHVDPEFYKQQELIVIREKSLRDVLGLSGKMASFHIFFDKNNNYKLSDLAQNAFQKRAEAQNTFDREVLKVTERVNIFNMAIHGTLLKVFPEVHSQNNKWISWNDPLATKPLSHTIVNLNPGLQLDKFTYHNIMRGYLISTVYAREKNDYDIPDKFINYIENIQRELTPPELLPTTAKIELEVYYNKSNIFVVLKYIYALLGMILLLLTFVKNFKTENSKTLGLCISLIVGLIIIAFAYQTFGMGLRWYIGGHAPWSNGYEVLLLVAWGGMLAGFSVIRYSKITIGSTALLAFFILLTAGHSYYDPQLTNLNPVLKSYWLIIHVAIITIGYGFLALSFLIGLINISLNLVKTKKKEERFSLVIQELSFINEKLVTVGMVLTAIGTFIGCIWANESWGNYWSWNAKQTWSLIIVLIYGLILHFKFIPKMKSALVFNIASVLSFGSVLMTFIGVNYYFTKGLHSYASDDPPIFPTWAWISIVSLLIVIVSALVKEQYFKIKLDKI